MMFAGVVGCMQRFCSREGLQAGAAGAATLRCGLGAVGLPRPGSQSGPGAQPILRLVHHCLHQTVSISARGQRVP